MRIMIVFMVAATLLVGCGDSGAGRQAAAKQKADGNRIRPRDVRGKWQNSSDAAPQSTPVEEVDFAAQGKRRYVMLVDYEGDRPTERIQLQVAEVSGGSSVSRIAVMERQVPDAPDTWQPVTIKENADVTVTKTASAGLAVTIDAEDQVVELQLERRSN